MCEDGKSCVTNVISVPIEQETASVILKSMELATEVVNKMLAGEIESADKELAQSVLKSIEKAQRRFQLGLAAGAVGELLRGFKSEKPAAEQPATTH